MYQGDKLTPYAWLIYLMKSSPITNCTPITTWQVEKRSFSKQVFFLDFHEEIVIFAFQHVLKNT